MAEFGGYDDQGDQLDFWICGYMVGLSITQKKGEVDIQDISKSTDCWNDLN